MTLHPAAWLAGLMVVATPAQDPPLRYAAGMLAEASFDQRVRAEVRTLAGIAGRNETIGREARLEVRVVAEGTSLRLEAWFDSLRVWRDGPEGRLLPDADALIGGRFRGVLSPEGDLVVHTRPFLPDEVAEVTDLAGALDDFLPRLPGVPLAPAGIWEAGGLRIVRRPDSSAAGERLLRLRWSRQQSDTVEQVAGEALTFAVRSHLEEEGDLVWHPVLGPLVWHRRATVTMDIPAVGAVRQPARTRMEEETWVWRRRTAM